MMIIKKINKIRFVATTTEGRKINVAYVGTSNNKGKVYRTILNRLQNRYQVHPERIEEIIQQEP